MSLDISKLQNVRARGDKTTARCPACAEAGGDNKGEHLIINEDGHFGCVLYSGDSADAKGHRKRIFALCGDREVKPLNIHGPRETAGLGRLGRVKQSQSAGQALKTQLLGRLGRVFETHLEPRAREARQDRLTTGGLSDSGGGVLGVLGSAAKQRFNGKVTKP